MAKPFRKHLEMNDFTKDRRLRDGLIQFIKGSNRLDGYLEKLRPLILQYFPSIEDWEAKECREYFQEIHMQQLNPEELEILDYCKSKRNAKIADADADAGLKEKREERKCIMDKIRKRHYALANYIYGVSSSKYSGSGSSTKSSSGKKKQSPQKYIDNFVDTMFTRR